MAEPDAAGRACPERHDPGETDTLFRDLADHDRLELARARIPQQIDGMLAIGEHLALRVVAQRLRTGERADHAEPVDAAGKARDTHVLARMHPPARGIDERKLRSLAITLFHEIDGFGHVDHAGKVLRS